MVNQPLFILGFRAPLCWWELSGYPSPTAVYKTHGSASQGHKKAALHLRSAPASTTVDQIVVHVDSSRVGREGSPRSRNALQRNPPHGPLTPITEQVCDRMCYPHIDNKKGWLEHQTKPFISIQPNITFMEVSYPKEWERFGCFNARLGDNCLNRPRSDGRSLPIRCAPLLLFHEWKQHYQRDTWYWCK